MCAPPFLLCCLFLLVLWCTAGGGWILGEDSFAALLPPLISLLCTLSFCLTVYCLVGTPQVEDDPLGEKDSFAALPPPEQRTWARAEDAGFGAKLKRLRQLRVTVPIAVRLVGFDGHGAGEVDVKPVRQSEIAILHSSC